MSAKIKILPENITNKIAAGEVVQRPESVVKELMENSVDAEARNIELIVRRAGKSLIQVVDDGIGMSEQDALLSFHKHATSKITSYEDIESLRTFGFRGEALSSIASVCQFEIKTETGDEEIGTLIKFDEENNIQKEKGSFSKGTSVSVKNLFYNTPARRNFLKTNATELKHIIETFKKISLSNPEVAFKLWNDDDLLFDFKSGTLENRVKEVFADNILDAVVEVKEITDYLSIRGYIAKPAFLKRSKGEQYLFINNRYVISKTINHAVFSAYENILEKGDYPFFVLFIDLDPSKVDINVHPQKLEVKFDDDNDIYRFVNAVIKKSLGSHDLVPAMTFGNDSANNEKLRYDNYRQSDKDDFSDRPSFVSKPNSNKQAYSDNEIDLLFSSLNKEIKQAAPGEQTDHPFDSKSQKEVYHSLSLRDENPTFIVALHNKYILAQIKSGLMIIDQHVAHERILYEKILNSFEANLPFSQQLLFAQTFQADPGDYALLKELEPYLVKMGFELKFFSKNTIVIDGVPGDLKVGSEIDALNEILDEYKTNQREKNLEVRDNLAKSFSCKAAIKAGDKLNEKEMRLLVDQLFATSMPYVCPHGRPIVIKIPLDELDKRFGRT
ncbi:MAG: DNA mismatch repair endonuclease MutL [Bacteroidetes bacterium]|nr:DNA mismatch repair endonuclease MutL [Bacteroidota bacterium]